VTGFDPEEGEGAAGVQRPLGWYSTGFDLKVPATTAVFSGQIQGNSVFRSQIRLRLQPRQGLSAA
jgi:hypothetical protein